MSNVIASNKVIYPELSYKIIRLVFKVHNTLGPGFTEDIYEEAMVYELDKNEIGYERQKPIEIFYKGHKMGNYRLDLVIDDKIILELKAVTDLNNIVRQQLASYLKATGLHLGILINFGSKRVESVRIAN